MDFLGLYLFTLNCLYFNKIIIIIIIIINNNNKTQAGIGNVIELVLVVVQVSKYDLVP
jgi:hypothetical protein